MTNCKKCGTEIYYREGYVTVITEIQSKTRITKHTDYFHLGYHDESKEPINK